jgi:hypothetical protein
MKPASSLFAPGRLSNSENVVSDCQRIAAAIASAASHVLNHSFFISKKNRFFTHLADFFVSMMVSFFSFCRLKINHMMGFQMYF